jgi:sortase A
MIQLVAVALVVVVAIALVRTRRGEGARVRSALAIPTAASAAAARPASNDPLGRVVDVLRRRRWMRRSLSGASLVMVVVAVVMLGWPFWTDVYQGRVQQRLDRQLASPTLQQAYKARSVGTGDALTRIKIPSIDVDVVVVEGTTQSALRAGAGHYPQTPLPCEPGNVAIAGHRTTYGKPFHNLDLLHPGDPIILETPIGKCTYKVVRTEIVLPTNTQVIDPTPVPMLTLTTCHPKGSARQRLVVHAQLQGDAVDA